MLKPRLALLVGIMCISIFPILVKLNYTPGLVSAFYRMLIAAILIVPYALLTRKLEWYSSKTMLLIVVCGILFGSDVAVWNIAIQESTATQASLLTNFKPTSMASLLSLSRRTTLKPYFRNTGPRISK